MKKNVTRRISSICLIFCLFLTAIFSDGNLSGIFEGITGINAVFADTGESSDDSTASDTGNASEDSEIASADTGTDDILGKITVYSGGEAITAASFGVSESLTLTAEYSGGESGSFGWQIYDSSQTTWFDIAGQETTEIQVGYAMVADMLDDKNVAYVRCKVTDGELLYYSEIVTLCVDTESTGSDEESASSGSDEENTASSTDGTSVSSNSDTESTLASTGGTSISSNSDAEEDTYEVTVIANDLPRVTSSSGSLQTYTITVEYKYYTDSTAYDSYTANIMAGADFSTTVTSPTIVGYTPYVDVTDETTEQTSGTLVYTYTDSSDVVHYVYGTEADTVSLSYTGIAEDDTVTVCYYPSSVSYTVLHYVQNILDDDYVLYKTESKTGYVGAEAEIVDLTADDSGDSEMNCGGYLCVSGSESTTIAADGSTRIYVYYDRVYFVMTFDLQGGSGVSPIYAKYGTEVSVSDPIKTGYDFAGWYDEEDTTQTILTSAELPSTIPAEKKRYVATWTAAQTTYTVVYWRENANDTDYSYWCQTTVKALTGSTIVLDDIKDLYESAISVTTISGMGSEVYASDVDTSKQYFIGNSGKYMVSSITGDGGTLTVSMTASGNISDYSAIPVFTVTSAGTDAYYISYESNGETYYLCFTDFTTLISAGGNTTASLSSTTDASAATVWYYDDYTSASSTQYGLYCKNTDTSDTNKYYLCLSGTSLAVKKNGSKVYLYDVVTTTTTDDEELDYFSYDENTTTNSFTTGTAVAADGSTVVNIYYSRNSYTLRYFFARYYNNKWYISTETQLTGGWFFQVFDDATNNVNSIQTINGILGSAKSLTIDNSNASTYADMAGIAESSVLLGTYYYVELTAKYNADISTSWPLAAGGTTDTTNTTDQNMILDTKENANGSAYYLFVSWGTQNGSTYWNSHSNKNIKGPYATMSAELIENKNASGSYVTSSEGSAHDLMAYYATGPYTYTYEVYMQNTDGTYSTEPTYTTTERSTATASGQNPYSYEGFTIITSATQITQVNTYGEKASVSISPDSTGRVYGTGTNSGSQGGTIQFYYSRNQYTLSFYNISDYIDEETLYYEEYLESYLIDATTMESTYYPTTYVEGVYEFGGWYTTPDCLDGTKVSSSTTMPAGDLVLYAKWIPKTYDVSVYQTSNLTNLVYNYDGQTQTSVSVLQWLTANNKGLEYGSSLPDSVHESGPETDIAENRDSSWNSGTGEIKESWIFVCWAYQKNGVEYALDVGSFTVFGDVDIYAKWTSSDLLSYEITYAEADLYVDNSGNIYDYEGGHLLSFDSSGSLYYIDSNTNETVYPTISIKSSSGEIADSTTGYLYEGANRTFTAKTGTGLYTSYQSGYYPLTSSHSVLMVDSSGTGTVTYVFLYIKAANVKYSVEFVDETGLNMFNVATHSYSASEIAYYDEITTTSSVVTENYLYFSGYTVDAVQKTLVLSANTAENVITFVYARSSNAPYTINYYYEVWFEDGNIGSYDVAVTDASSGDTKYYLLFTTESGTVSVGGSFNVQTDNLTGLTSNGYEYVYHDVYQYSWNNTTNTVDEGTATTYTTYGGTTVTVENVYGALTNVFYNLRTYPYIVYHVYLDSGDNVIDPIQGTATYTSKVTYDPLTDSELETAGVYGYTAVDTTSKTITIEKEEVQQGSYPTVNVITFTYREKVVTYQYKTMLQNYDGTISELDNKNVAALSVESENVAVDHGTAVGSVAYYDSVICEFVGWYLDEACTIPITTGTTYSYASVADTTFTLNGNSTDTQQLTPQKVEVATGKYIYQSDTSLNTTVNTETVQVLYALFRVNSLTIKRENQDQEHYNSANSFVYTVTRLTDSSGNPVSGNDEIVMTVTINPGEDSVTIYNLPAGTYKVEQQNDWSWRYDDTTFLVESGAAEVETVELKSGEAKTVTFNNAYNRYWLSGFSNALTNVNGS